ncbi:MAG: M20/M25/M40 family metallo-hydrolase [Myxococcaceae bacterium]|nr:M20/M25/M40 family metallo-hydrolase [Myxococcaceae bacterium]
MRPLVLGVLAVSCATAPTTASQAPAVSPLALAPAPGERHFADLRQLTFGGENAEAYWRFDGQGFSLQARGPGEGCDHIETLRLSGDGPLLRSRVSSGKGATTCAHFFPGDQRLLYASTHLGGDACPPRPDMRQGYVWALYDSYDIFSAQADGSALTRLTDTPGYDAEGTVCAKDGSVIFTSVRDGDLELYRMDADGKNVKRLTFTPGYDGGAFFNRDCSKIVWRASRPKVGPELDEFRALLKQGLVRPTQLELYVANADGSDAHQVTHLGSASFAPFFTPDSKRIVFSSNYPDPKGREFDLWAIDVDGTRLERITTAKGFDGFPMFSPDGKFLAFSSNRATAEGQHDTNLFLARWVDTDVAPPPSPADQAKADVSFLAAPEREGRGLGTAGLEAAAQYLVRRFEALGLSPAGDQGTFLQHFESVTALGLAPATKLTINGVAVAAADFTPLGWSGQGSVSGEVAFVDYGIVDEQPRRNDYDELDVKGKVVLVRRFAPDLGPDDSPASQRRRGDLRHKAFVARARGAKALLVVDLPPPMGPVAIDGQKLDELPPDARLPALEPEGTGDAGLPVVVVKREVLRKALAAFKGKPTLKHSGSVPRFTVSLTVALQPVVSPAANVVGRIEVPGATRTVVLGAHYDHLGLGGRDSLAPDVRAPHPGADDNASGVAAVLEAAGALVQRKAELKANVLVVAFSGEEAGVLGSSHLVKSAPELIAHTSAMLNLDMVGRLRSNRLQLLGSESAVEWKGLVDAACLKARVDCEPSGDGYGPSDHMPFYTAGVPVLHLFSGAHSDYHKPSDTPDTLNYTGVVEAAQVVTELAVAAAGASFTYQKLAAPVRGDARSFGASLGTVPDYGGPPPGERGVLLADVRPGGGADKGGLRKGDVLVKLGTQDVGSVEDLMYVLMGAKPGQTVKAVVHRAGATVVLEVTFQEGRRR